MKLRRIIAVAVAACCFAGISLSVIPCVLNNQGNNIVRADSNMDFATAFAERMYTIVLGRSSDSVGIAYWSNKLVSGEITGAACAQGFFDSDEFINKNVSDEEFINIAYRSILGREADNSGREYWCNWLRDGMTRNSVLDGFIRSTEFNNICAQYGIIAGSLTLTSAMDTHPYANAFVADIYRNFLNRDPDPSGWNTWVTQLTNGSISASNFLEGVIYSPEFAGLGVSDHDYIGILYKGILGRTASESEISYWLDLSYSRPMILMGIAQSAEFAAKCERAGVNVGIIDVNSSIEKKEIGKEFAALMFESILGRTIDAQSADTWGNLVANGTTASDMIGVLYSCDEFINKNYSDEDYITNVYNSILGRNPSSTDFQNWYTLFEESNVSRYYVIKALVNSAEFATRCENFGIAVGSFAVVEGRDYNPEINDFVINAYESMLGVSPTTEELNHWSESLATLSNTGESFIYSLATDGRFLSKSTQDQVTALYKACMGRIPSQSELNSMVAMAQSSGINSVIATLTGSTEFNSVCDAHGVSANLSLGWNTTVNGRIYFNGTALLSGWQRIDGNRYYFDPANNNVAAAGWKFVDGLKYYFDPNNNVLIQNVDAILGHRDSYYLTVNCATNVVMVYAQDVPGGAYNIPVRAIVCSTGRYETPTIQGDFTIRRQGRWNVLAGPVWGQYCSNISGNYLFHSAWYYENGNNMSLSVRQYNLLGQNASHGCVRLTTADAMWIYNNCHGSSVHIFTDPNVVAPFDKPVAPQAVPVNGDRGYDPTDPSL